MVQCVLLVYLTSGDLSGSHRTRESRSHQRTLDTRLHLRPDTGNGARYVVVERDVGCPIEWEGLGVGWPIFEVESCLSRSSNFDDRARVS